MSRAYRISVRETLNRVIRARDLNTIYVCRVYFFLPSSNSRLLATRGTRALSIRHRISTVMR